MTVRILLICYISIVGVHCSDFLSDFVGSVRKRLRAEDLDGEFAERVYKAVSTTLIGQRFTNWTQIAQGIEEKVWIRFEQEFLRQSEGQRGFKHSIWEKYVFINPGVEVQPYRGSPGGDLILLQARPPTGITYRYAIWMPEGSDFYELRAIDESEIRRWFEKAQRPIPAPPANLPPATPADWELQQSARDLAERQWLKEVYRRNGITWLDLYRNHILIGLIAAFIVLSTIIWRRRRMNHR